MCSITELLYPIALILLHPFWQRFDLFCLRSNGHRRRKRSAPGRNHRKSLHAWSRVKTYLAALSATLKEVEQERWSQRKAARRRGVTRRGRCQAGPPRRRGILVRNGYDTQRERSSWGLRRSSGGESRFRIEIQSRPAPHAAGLLRVAVQAAEEEIHTDVGEDDREETEDGNPRRALAAPAAHETAMQEHRVDEPRDQ